MYTFAVGIESANVDKVVLAIRRAERYSPGAVERDAAIIEAVDSALRVAGRKVMVITEESIEGGSPLPEADLILSMARGSATLSALAEQEARGVRVINSVAAVRACTCRSVATRLMVRGGVPLPPQEGNEGYWLKRGDGPEREPLDVRFAATAAEAGTTAAQMKAEGIAEVITQAHVTGQVVKFYGVAGADFFHTNAPEASLERLRTVAEQAAEATGAQVYGGDAVVQPSGAVVIIDFNDWPSFSPCVEAAAEAIVALALKNEG